MAEFMHAAPWIYTSGASGTITPSRLRSLSPPVNKTVTKSISSPQLKKFNQSIRPQSGILNTIPDPRAHTLPSPMSRSSSTCSAERPDLSQESQEVATLSKKLIDAINHQTSLDDSLQQTRHELERARTKAAQLELQVKVHEQKVAKGLLVDKEIYDKMEKQFLSEMHEERRRRAEAEKAKKKTDNEVETLTTALFEEANQMVAAARKETEASEKKNEQLRQQLKDAETLQASMQEQLQDLKSVMEKMSAQGDDESNTLPTTTAPSTPGITPADKMSKMFDANGLTPNTPGSDEIPPNHPLHFTHLIHPVLRSDLASVKDFQDMLKTSSRSAPNSRASSGNYGSLNVLGLGSLTNTSTSSLPLSKSPSSLLSNTSRESSAGVTNLKDEKFYKRALSEDIEPTLRLDLAPGLSWMARRTVLSSITAGSLVVEPAPVPKFRGAIFPCSLCGETRKEEQYARKFRFKSSESDETRHPLCDWCLGRIRSTCDYISFLRMVAAGHWRAETEEEKKAAWEESVRLRERMFWCRIGGGVVPSFTAIRDSPRSPTFTNRDGKLDPLRKSEESQLSDKPLDSAVDMAESTHGVRKSEDDPFRSKGEDQVKRVSIGTTLISGGPEHAPTEVVIQEEAKKVEEETEAPTQKEETKVQEETQTLPQIVEKVEAEAEAQPQDESSLTQEEEKKIEAEAEAQLHEEVRKSLDVKAVESQAQFREEVSEYLDAKAAESQSQPQEEIPESLDDKPAETKPQPQPQSQRPVSLPVSPNPSPKKKDDRLSLTIPGSFE